MEEDQLHPVEAEDIVPAIPAAQELGKTALTVATTEPTGGQITQESLTTMSWQELGKHYSRSQISVLRRLSKSGLKRFIQVGSPEAPCPAGKLHADPTRFRPTQGRR